MGMVLYYNHNLVCVLCIPVPSLHFLNLCLRPLFKENCRGLASQIVLRIIINKRGTCIVGTERELSYNGQRKSYIGGWPAAITV